MNSKSWKIYGEKTTLLCVQDTQFQTFRSGDKTCKSLYNILGAKIKTACSCYWECSTSLSHLLNFDLNILTTFRYTMHSFNPRRTSLCKIRTLPQAWMHCPAFYTFTLRHRVNSKSKTSLSLDFPGKIIGKSSQHAKRIWICQFWNLKSLVWGNQAPELVLSVCLSTVFSDSKALWCSLCLATSRCATGSPCDVSYSTCTTVYVIATNSSNKFNMFMSTSWHMILWHQVVS